MKYYIFLNLKIFLTYSKYVLFCIYHPIISLRYCVTIIIFSKFSQVVLYLCSSSTMALFENNLSDSAEEIQLVKYYLIKQNIIK